MAMKSYRSARRAVATVLSASFVLGASWLAGCGPSGVGSTPSNKQEVSDYLSKHPEAGQLKGVKPGANVQGPRSIKSKLFAGKTGKTE